MDEGVAICPRPDKVRHSSRRTAEAALYSLWHDIPTVEERLDVRAYLCPCGSWHLGHRSIYEARQ